MNYMESMNYAKENGGRLLRMIEIEQLLAQEKNTPLCPDGEMWIASAYDKWIQVGPYCATFKYKTGSRINKNSGKFNIYRQEPYGDLGLLYIIERPPRNTIKDVLKYYN